MMLWVFAGTLHGCSPRAGRPRIYRPGPREFSQAGPLFTTAGLPGPLGILMASIARTSKTALDFHGSCL